MKNIIQIKDEKPSKGNNMKKKYKFEFLMFISYFIRYFIYYYILKILSKLYVLSHNYYLLAKPQSKYIIRPGQSQTETLS